ncbi:MAG: hypothetical protein Q8Q59_01670 [Luteolibacter sp.]|jgi:hypothetical protein|nr:hypothetical protein [Luteolibacter sp.]
MLLGNFNQGNVPLQCKLRDKAPIDACGWGDHLRFNLRPGGIDTNVKRSIGTFDQATMADG